MPLFSRNTPAETTTTTTTEKRHGLFHRTNEDAFVNDNTEKRHGLFHRNGEDASITAARDRVMSAEAAERDADRALAQARLAVREAREAVKRLEREAAEEARLAKIKQGHAKSISRSSKHLGRHEHV